MTENLNQFAIYSAKILDILYDSFPVYRFIDKNIIIAEYLKFDEDDEMKELRKDLMSIRLLEQVVDEEKKEILKNKKPLIEEEIEELEQVKRSDRYLQEKIYHGTLEFIVSEGLVRDCKDNGYQLTAKGFSHLSMTYQNGEISDESKTNISILKAIFDKTSDASLQVAAGTAVNVLTKILGYS